MSKSSNQSRNFYHLLLAFVAAASLTGTASAAEFHVSPLGNDANPGSASKPFATLEHARNAMHGTMGAGDVVLHSGTYVLSRPLLLTPQDSRTRYIAAKGEAPLLTSAHEISGWKIAEPSTPALQEIAKGNVWVAEIQKNWRFHFLYLNGVPATRSRSVNDDRWRQWGRPFSFEPATPTGQRITFENKALLKNLPSNGDVEMCVILFQFGVMGGGVMTDFNPEQGVALWHSKQGQIHPGRPEETAFRLENALAFIDQPGEWAVDSAAGKVYYWPKAGENLSDIKVTAPTLNELIRIQGDDVRKEYVHQVAFEGITLACTDRLPEDQWPDNWTLRQWENPDAMIFMEGVEDCAVRNCRMYRSGSYGVTLYRHALRNEVSGCEIGWTGCGGVHLFGFGAGYRDENQANVVRRNYMHNHGCSIYWHSPNVQIVGSGANVVEENFLAMSAYNNVSITGVLWDTLNNWRGMGTPHQVRSMVDTLPYAVDFSTYPPEVMAQIKAGKRYFTQETYRELVHSRDNKIARNIAFECHTRLEEGGALYTWCPGKGNQFTENVIYKSHGLPGSSIISLDDHSEYLTVTGNVVWCEGRAGCGTIGVRDQEKGNVFKDNIRSFDKYGDAKHCEGEPGRKKFDALYRNIKSQVDKAGGWPGNPDLDEWIARIKTDGNPDSLTPDEIKKLHKLM